MLRNVQELATIRPHDTDGAKWTPPEYRAYCVGYTRGVVAALMVLDLAYAEWKLHRSAKRRAGPQHLEKKGAA